MSPRMPARRLAVLALALASCVERPPEWAPTPVASGPDGGGCAKAQAMRARAPKLLEEGKLDRAVRVLQRAEELCPAEGPATWAPRVKALADLGRAAEAMQLAGRIDRSDRASDADRAAAKAARAVAEEHARTVAAAGSRRDDPELYDPAEKRRQGAADLFRRGAEAARSGDAAAAKKLFLESWNTWHPSPRALVEAGLAAQALGDRAEAQRLFDRAAYDDSATGIRPEIAGFAPRAVGGATAVWEPSARAPRLAMAGDEEITVLEADLAPALRIRPGEAVSAVAFAGSATIAAGLGGGRLRLYDAVIGAQRAEMHGHQGAVKVIAASPDGRTIATAADDTAVRLWDTASGNAGRIFGTKRTPVALAFSNDGARLAFAEEGSAVTLAEVATGAVKPLPRARGAVRALRFEGNALYAITATERLRYDLDHPQSPPRTLGRGRADGASAAGSAVAIEAGAEVTAIDLASGATIAKIPTADHGGLAAIAIAPATRTVALIYRDRTVAVVPAPGGDRLEHAPAAPLAAIAVASTGKRIAGAGEDGRVLLWGADAPRLEAIAAPSASALAFSPDARTLAIGLEKRIDLHSLAGQPSADLDASARVQALAFSADGLRLAAGTDAPAALVFAAGGSKPTHDLKLERGPVRAVRFSPDGRAILIAPREGVVRWEPEAHKSSRLLPYGPEPRDVVFTADGAGMIVADKRGELLFGKPTDAAPTPGLAIAVPGQALALAASANGMIATGEGDRSVSLRGPNGKVVVHFREPESAVRAVALLPQGIIAASFADGLIRLFRAPGPAPVAVLRPASGLRPGALAGIVESPSGHLELLGPDAAAARASIRCRVGPALYPFDVCAEQFTMENLLPLILAGQDPAEADP